MSRWIDADDAIERLGAYLMADAQIDYGGMASEDIEDQKELATDILRDAPSTDIVKCKECKYWDRYQDRFCGHIAEYTNADDFCSYGEPKGISTDCAWK